jgi:glucan biosynthesis protein C
MSPLHTASPTVAERRDDLDRLRVFACYLLLLFHSLMVFNPAPFYHVRNGELSTGAMIAAGFIGLWHMPLLFLLAGWSAHASLSRRGVASFTRERVSKLAIPLVAGCVLLAPGIKYLELRSGLDMNHRGLSVRADLQESFARVIPGGLPEAPPFDESFTTFLPSFFTDIDRFSWSHLWFLAYLFTFTLLCLPLFTFLMRSRRTPERVSRAWVYAPLAVLLAGELLLRERFPGPYNLYRDWANVTQFATYLVAGFLLARVPALELAVRAEWRRAAGVSLLAMTALLVAVLGRLEAGPLLLAGPAVAGWCAVVAIVGFANERLRRPARWLRYGRETAFPVYLLHQPAIVFLGYGVVQLPLGLWTKFAVLLTGSAALTLGFYHVLVRPFALARRLCGIAGRTENGPTSASTGLVQVHGA